MNAPPMDADYTPRYIRLARLLRRWIGPRAANMTGVDLGQEEWEGVCQKCHKLNERYVGPALAGNPLLADERGLTELVRNGRGDMPAVGSNWTDDQITALIAYTKRFANQQGGSSGG